MSLNSTHKIILNTVVLFLAAIFIIFGVISPTTKRINETTKNIYGLRALMEKKYQQSMRSRLTKSKIEQIKEETSTYPTYLFHVRDTLKLIQDLENIAKKNNTEQKIKSSNLDKITTQDKVNINLDITGKYMDLLNHLHDLEMINYFFNIEELRLAPQITNNKKISNNASLNVVLSLYVSK